MLPALDSKLKEILTRVAKPAQYLGGEVNVIKKDFEAAKVRVCLIFPDKYELGMSHVGLKILYEILNRIPDVVCERAFAVELDMASELKKARMPLFSWESKRPLADFDLLGFSFTYELTYTNFLNILDLAQIPLWQKERIHHYPLVIGGGGSMMNTEPIADFLDAAVLGDGEEIIIDLVNKIRSWKQAANHPKPALLDSLTEIEGVYVPSFFEPSYNEDGTIKEIKPLKAGYEKIKKRTVSNLDEQVYPTKLLVPSVKLIHDRIGIEIQRGCNRACRFCQAGYIFRPVRQRSPETILNIAEESLKNTGIEEISLLSLSAADYEPIVALTKELNDRYSGRKIAISVPATRTEKLTPELIDQIKKVRKTGFTIAPEAGSPRMRRVINKGNLSDDLYQAVHNAFSKGWDTLKLYYMIGLPFELDEDVLGIANEGNESIKICFKYSQRTELNLSVSSFVPKPHTPFQWAPQIELEEIKRKHNLVRHNLKNKRIRMKYHKPEMSFLEGLFSRGDRRISGLLHAAFEEQCGFDEWEEHFDFSKWERALQKWGGDVDFYLYRKRPSTEILPWDHLFSQMDKMWLWDEYQKAYEAALDGLTPDKKEYLMHLEEHHDRRRLNPLPDQMAGFTEDCSVARCSYCGVCDFKGIKNKIYVQGDQPVMAKKGNREWYGWKPDSREKTLNSPLPLLKVPQTLRIQYAKRGLAALMGHLEVMGIFKRAFKRLQLEIAYSQGFHPHMKMNSSPPLPLGIESDWEYIDVDLLTWIAAEKFLEKMNTQLPEGLYVTNAQYIDKNTPALYSSIGSLVYRAAPAMGEWPTGYYSHLLIQKDKEELWWTKETAKGEKLVNIKELIDVDLNEKEIILEIKFKPEGSVKPQSALKVLLDPYPLEGLMLKWEKIKVNIKTSEASLIKSFFNTSSVEPLL